jgi:molecular chaperone GrpE
MTRQKEDEINKDGDMKMNNKKEEPKVINENETLGCDEISIEELKNACEEYRNTAEEYKMKSEEYLKNLKTLKAEFENYRKREMQYRESFIKSSNRDLILKLLPVMDDMDNAILESKKNEVHQSYVEGAELIYRKLLNILEKEGVRQITTLGEKFDPKYHEAMMTISSPDYEDYAIVDELRKGYMLNEEVLRAAQVSVNRWDKNEKER